MGDREASAMEMAEDESVEMGEGESGEKFRRWRWMRNFGGGDEASDCEKFQRWEKFLSSEY